MTGQGSSAQSGPFRLALVEQPWARAVPPSESVAIWILEVGRRLAREHDVWVYGSRGGGDQPLERHHGATFRLFSALGDWRLQRMLSVTGPAWPARRPYFSSLSSWSGYASKVSCDLRHRGRHIAHVHNLSQFLPVIHRLNPTVGLVLHMHCDWLTDLDPRMVESRLRHADLILGCSDHLTERVRAAFPHHASRCHTVQNGVDVDQFDGPVRAGQEDPEGLRLLYVGRISPEKGIHVLMGAFERVLEQFPGAELDLVGPEGIQPREYYLDLTEDPVTRSLTRFYEEPGSYGEQLRRRLPPHVARRVHFRGAAPFSDMAAHYRSSDVLVLPSVWDEPSGMGVREAMAASLPVVCTRSGGMPEAVQEGRTGLVVERNDAKGLAAALVHLLERPDRRRAMGEAGRERAARHFSWDRVTADLLDLYRDLAARSPG